MGQHKQMEWAEPLPEQCPPNKAHRPKNEGYFRLVDTIPPTERDFYSHRKLFPNKSFNTDECRARAISLLQSFDDCANYLLLPDLKNKKIVSITLPPESGVVLKTGNKSHYSWWRVKDFDALAYSREVAD